MPKSILTDSKVVALKANKGERLEHADTVVNGLRIRVTPKAKTWALRVRAGGKVRTITLGQFGHGTGKLTLAAARAKAIQTLGSIAGGSVPRPAFMRRAERSNRVRDQIDRFQKEYAEDRVKRPDYYRWMFDKYVIPEIGDWDVAAIKRRDLGDMLDGIRKRHGVTTARRVGGLLKRLFKFCAASDVVDADPAASLLLPGKERRRERTLTEEELRAFWTATDPALHPGEKDGRGRLKAHPSNYPWGAYFRLLLFTGQRRGEVANMRWSAIDLDTGTWTLRADETKSARAHIVPLNEPAVDLLEGLPRLVTVEGKESDFVLTTNARRPIADFSKPKTWLDEAMAEALGVEAVVPWRIHDIRRTVSTNLARLGVEPFIRRRVLNHALTGVDAVYDQFDYLEPKRLALDLWATELMRIVEEREAGENVITMRERA